MGEKIFTRFLATDDFSYFFIDAKQQEKSKFPPALNTSLPEEESLLEELKEIFKRKFPEESKIEVFTEYAPEAIPGYD